jgi:threonine synthase
MDILISSNLERQLYELNGRDPAKIRQWMQDLQDNKSFTVDKPTFSKIRESFSADWVSNADCLETIRRVFTDHGYLLDPHSAVAWLVAERLRSTPDSPVLVTAAAHWAKFASDIYRALAGLEPAANLPDDVATLAIGQLLERIQTEFGAGAIPNSLVNLDDKQIRFTETSAGTREGLEQSILAWLDRQEGCEV